MQEYYFEMPVNNSKLMCIGPITKREAENIDSDDSLSSGFGYYLYVADASRPSTPVEVLAKMVSEEAAQRMALLLAGRLPAMAA